MRILFCIKLRYTKLNVCFDIIIDENATKVYRASTVLYFNRTDILKERFMRSNESPKMALFCIL